MADGFPKSVGMNRQQPMVLFPSNLYFDTQFRHRTGVHSDADSTGSRTPEAPYHSHVLDQPPGRAAYRLSPAGVLQAHLHLSDLLPDPLFASPTCAAAASCCVWCTGTKNDLALVPDPIHRQNHIRFHRQIRYFTGKFDISQANSIFHRQSFHFDTEDFTHFRP